jgi:hypothetical protein
MLYIVDWLWSKFATPSKLTALGVAGSNDHTTSDRAVLRFVSAVYGLHVTGEALRQ